MSTRCGMRFDGAPCKALLRKQEDFCPGCQKRLEAEYDQKFREYQLIERLAR